MMRTQSDWKKNSPKVNADQSWLRCKAREILDFKRLEQFCDLMNIVRETFFCV